MVALERVLASVFYASLMMRKCILGALQQVHTIDRVSCYCSLWSNIARSVAGIIYANQKQSWDHFQNGLWLESRDNEGFVATVGFGNGLFMLGWVCALDQVVSNISNSSLECRSWVYAVSTSHLGVRKQPQSFHTIKIHAPPTVQQSIVKVKRPLI